jgi:hypothetical protein
MMTTDQQRLVNYLQTAIDALLLVIDLEQKITHNAHPNWTYSQILNDLRCQLDGETALLRLYHEVQRLQDKLDDIDYQNSMNA